MPSAPDSVSLSQALEQVGDEVAHPLLVALDRLRTLQQHADPALKAALAGLHEPLRRAREGALLAQQLGRLSSGRVRPGQMSVPLHDTLQALCAQRRREAEARGLQLRTEWLSADIETDPVLLDHLLSHLLDWALAHTCSSVDLRMALSPWPVRAQLTCRFAVRPLDQIQTGSSMPDPSPLSLAWLFVQEAGALLGVEVDREDEGPVWVAVLRFPAARMSALGATVSLPPEVVDEGHNTQPFGGAPALVITQRPELLRALGAVMDPLGWDLDRAESVDAARALCRHRLPKLIVVDGALRSPDMAGLCAEIRADVPQFPLIEVVPAGRATQMPMRGVSPCPEAHLRLHLPALLKRAFGGAPAPAAPELTFRV